MQVFKLNYLDVKSQAGKQLYLQGRTMTTSPERTTSIEII